MCALFGPCWETVRLPQGPCRSGRVLALMLSNGGQTDHHSARVLALMHPDAGRLRAVVSCAHGLVAACPKDALYDCLRCPPAHPSCSSLQGFAVASGSAPATYTLYVSLVCHRRTFDNQYGIAVYIYDTNHRCPVRPLSEGLDSAAKKLQQVVVTPAEKLLHGSQPRKLMFTLCISPTGLHDIVHDMLGFNTYRRIFWRTGRFITAGSFSSEAAGA